MNWIILIIAGFFETAFAICLGKANQLEGNDKIWWLSGFIIFLIMSMILLYKAAQSIPIGTAYAVWTGIGAVGTVTLGIIFLKEPLAFWRMFFLLTLIGSIVGLKVVRG